MLAELVGNGQDSVTLQRWLTLSDLVVDLAPLNPQSSIAYGANPFPASQAPFSDPARSFELKYDGSRGVSDPRATHGLKAGRSSMRSCSAGNATAPLPNAADFTICCDRQKGPNHLVKTFGTTDRTIKRRSWYAEEQQSLSGPMAASCNLLVGF